jgi:hypothetical protein
MLKRRRTTLSSGSIRTSTESSGTRAPLRTIRRSSQKTDTASISTVSPPADDDEVHDLNPSPPLHYRPVTWEQLKLSASFIAKGGSAVLALCGFVWWLSNLDARVAIIQNAQADFGSRVRDLERDLVRAVTRAEASEHRLRQLEERLNDQPCPKSTDSVRKQD